MTAAASADGHAREEGEMKRRISTGSSPALRSDVVSISRTKGGFQVFGLFLVLLSVGVCGMLGVATAAETDSASDADDSASAYASGSGSGLDLEPEDDAASSKWTPAFRLGTGVHSQGLDGRVFGPDVLPFLQAPSGIPDDPSTEINENFDFSTASAPGDSATTIEFRFDVRLYAPDNLLPLPDAIRPRLFVQIGAEVPLDDGFVASRYDANFDNRVEGLYGAGLEVDDFCPEVPPTEACTYSARTNFDIVANWSVGIGADFTLPVMDNQFHLVPYVGYFGQAYESDSEFSVSLAQNLESDNLLTIASATGTEILHGVSGGLGFEIDLYESDLIALRLFIETRATWILSDRETKYDGTNSAPIANFTSADFLIRPSGFIVTQSAGVEIRWNGN